MDCFSDFILDRYADRRITCVTGVEKSWLEEHGGIRIGFLDNDPVVFSMDKKSGEIRGSLPEYIS